MLNELGISHERLHMVDPMSYLEFNFPWNALRRGHRLRSGITEETNGHGRALLDLARQHRATRNNYHWYERVS